MKKYLLLLMVGISLSSCKCSVTTGEEAELEKRMNKYNTEEKISFVLEQAYFEGQLDAIEGDIRIELDDKGYIWTKSPWDSGREPVSKILNRIEDPKDNNKISY